MSQTETVLRHMQKFGSITPIEAMNRYGIMRLGARIWDLKRAGVEIRREVISGTNRFGDNVRYARYSLKEKKHEAD